MTAQRIDCTTAEWLRMALLTLLAMAPPSIECTPIVGSQGCRKCRAQVEQWRVRHAIGLPMFDADVEAL